MAWLAACGSDETEAVHVSARGADDAGRSEAAPEVPSDGGVGGGGEDAASPSDGGSAAAPPGDDGPYVFEDEVLFDIEWQGRGLSTVARRDYRAVGIWEKADEDTAAGFPFGADELKLRPSDGALLYVHQGVVRVFHLDRWVQAERDFPSRKTDASELDWTPQENDDVIETVCDATYFVVDPDTSKIMYACGSHRNTSPTALGGPGCIEDVCVFYDEAGKSLELPRYYDIAHLGHGGTMLLEHFDPDANEFDGYAIRDPDGVLTTVTGPFVMRGRNIRATEDGFLIPERTDPSRPVDAYRVTFDGKASLLEGPDVPVNDYAINPFECGVEPDETLTCAADVKQEGTYWMTILRLDLQSKSFEALWPDTGHPLWNVIYTITAP